MEGIGGYMFFINASVDSDVGVKGRSWRGGDSADDDICNDTEDSNGIGNEKGEKEEVAAVVVDDDADGEEDTGSKSIDSLR